MKIKSVRTKLLGGFLAVVVLIILLVIINYNYSSYVKEELEDVFQNDVPALINQEQLAFNTAQRLGLLRGYVLFEDEEYRDLLHKYSEESLELQKDLLEQTDDEAVRQLVDQSNTLRDLVIEEVIEEFDQGNEEVALENLYSKVEPLSREIILSYMDLASEREAEVNQRATEIIQSGKSSVIETFVVSLIIIILAIVVALITSRAIINPLNKLRTGMKHIADGDLSQAAIETKSADEIGQVIIATNEMKEKMRELITKINEASQTLSNQSEELMQSANEVSQGSEQIASTMEELASGTEMEANTASDLSETMNTFSSKVQEANENGESVERYSHEVLEMTNRGNRLMNASLVQIENIEDIVHDAVKKVEGLDTHTQQITNIISVIQDIADQINLLALNAAIEAARAGEHGRGFAVVAEEVKQLAEQSSASVENIATFIHNIQSESTEVSKSLQGGFGQVEAGIKQVQETGQTFNDISSAVTKMVSNIQLVTSNLTEIAQDSKQMNASVQEIAAITEETAAGIEETTASTELTSAAMLEVSTSSKELSRLAQQLNDLINQFKL